MRTDADKQLEIALANKEKAIKVQELQNKTKLNENRLKYLDALNGLKKDFNDPVLVEKLNKSVANIIDILNEELG